MSADGKIGVKGKDKRAVFQGTWVRCSRYVVINGWIRAAEGADVYEYNPYEEYYYQAFQAEHHEPTPYEALYAIGREAKAQGSIIKDGVCPDKLIELITQFCQKYGLLGILLQQAHQVVFPPQLDYVSGTVAEQWQAAGMSYDDASKKREMAVMHCRHPLGTWAEIRHAIFKPEEFVTLTKVHKAVSFLKTLFRRSSLEEKSWPQPGVLIQPDIDKPELRVKDFRAGWAQFFPSVSETDWEKFRTPLPSDSKFWTLYAEPVECFLAKAELVYDLCHGLEERASKRQDEILELLGRVSTITTSIRPTFIYRHGKYQMTWTSPSLFAAIVMMMATDLSSNVRFLSCENCGVFFTSKAYQAKYCVDGCKTSFHRKTKEASHALSG